MKLTYINCYRCPGVLRFTKICKFPSFFYLKSQLVFFLPKKFLQRKNVLFKNRY
jgi:hypothetical protein